MATKYCVGLDIGSSSIKVVQAKVGKRGVVVQAFDIEPLAPQTIVDGTIMNQAAVVEAIRSVWTRQKLKHKGVAIAISGHSVIIKKIAVPPMTDEELVEQIPWEAEHHIPFAKDDVELDYHVVTPKNAAGQMELLLVAAKKEVVHDFAAVAREAALSPQVIDVAAFTVQNAYEANYDPPAGEIVVLLNVGAAISHINVVRDGVSLFSRDVAIGGNAITEEIQKQLGVPFEEAEAVKSGTSQNPEPRDVDRILEAVSEVLASELQRSLDFFLATTAEGSASKIFLCGGSAKLPALFRAVERRSRLPVELLDAWNRVQLDSRMDGAFAAAHSQEAMVALGLALRAPGDK